MGVFGTKIGKRLNSNFSLNSGGGMTISSVRVKKIILDDVSEPELFSKYGEWNSLGAIFYEPVYNPATPGSTSYLTNIAYPLFSNIKNYPLENEIVFLLSLSSTDSQVFTSNEVNYYISPINMWNSIHHNALPETVWQSLLPESQRKDYVQTSTGNVRRVTDGSTEISLGSTFVEKTDIKSLLPYEGDVIHEGRWGNSIRIGSTVNNAKISNNWSTNGNNGEPLIIIRNGQYNDGKDPWVPIVEDINKDKSSIYITSTQNVPVKTETNYNSYSSEKPAAPDKYSGNQIILNSGRLVFNSTSDHILLSSNKTISFNAVKGFNFDTNSNFVVNAKQIKLGSKEAKEPLLLGDSTLESLNNIFTSLSELSIALQVISTLLPSPGAIPIVAAATALSTKLSAELTKYKGKNSPLKSKQNFTI